MNATALELAKRLKEQFNTALSDPEEFRGEISLWTSTVDVLPELFAFAKKELGFDYLLDITSIDNYGEEPRFELVYHLSSLEHGRTIRVKARLTEEKGQAPSVTGVWRTADWHEREIYDMMGIRFAGHPDLRRILMWEGYPYFPLRKDFPLAGRATELPDVAFTEPSPMAGGPFVTIAGGKDSLSREPRVRIPESETVELNARLERRQDVKPAHGASYGPGPVSRESKES